MTELLVVVACLALIAVILFPVFMRSRENAKMPSCANNLKQLGLGFMQYTQDYNEHMPLIVVSSASIADNPSTKRNESSYYGWADALFPYVKTTSIYHCTDYAHGNGSPDKLLPLARDCTDYWLNGRVAGTELSEFRTPASTIMLGDGNDGGDMTDARYNYSMLPAPWLNDKNSPIYRHHGGSSYCFMDGHVKYIQPGEISTTSAKPKWRFSP